ncbi:Signal transduction histidine kinase [Donghicola eburneus]|uniref:histidine kinase n=2 Tax=Donghicola eburneus TaxID=393278 RepID=A0A1M4MY46_9RHOB|nr:putative PAS domain-containing two-component system sensor histidine kinase/response regulator [Donghicola eburneus]SFQ06038.1 Signal transduction histidine kinase [Donghicola eburneus]
MMAAPTGRKPTYVWGVGLLWISVFTCILFFTGFTALNILHRQQAFQQKIVQADIILVRLNNQLGYGGFIHNFKNAVLRPDEKDRYLDAFGQNALAIKALIEQTEQHFPDLTNEIKNLGETLNEYTENAEFLRQTELRQPLDIDPIVRVNDDFAVQALLNLLQSNRDQMTETLSQMESRKIVLSVGAAISFISAITATAGLLIYARNRSRIFRAAVEENRRTSEMIEDVGGAIFKLGSDGEVEVTNRKGRAMFGALIERQSVPLVDRMLETFPEIALDDPLLRAFLGRKVDSEISLYTFPDQSQRYLRIFSAPLSNQNQGGAVIEITDVTQNMVAEKLEDQNRNILVLGQVARSVVHDVRNVNATLRFTLERLKGQDLGGSTPALITNALSALSVSDKLAKRLLDFATAGRDEVTNFEASDVLTMLRSLSDGIAQDQILIDVRKAPAGARLTGSPNAVLAALINLVVNARNALVAAGQDGQITVHLDSEELHPSIPGWVFRVTDTGPGFPQEIIAGSRSSAPTRSAEGYGLGLSIVHSVAVDMGGYVQLSNRAGRGAEVSIHLPAHHSAEPLMQTAQTLHASARVLLVDDSMMVTRLLERQFAKIGIATHQSHSAKAALLSLQTHQYDLVITDYDLGEEQSGKDIAAATHELQPDVPVIVFTKTPEWATEAFAHLNVEIFGKGNQTETLISRAKSLLARSPEPADAAFSTKNQ